VIDHQNISTTAFLASSQRAPDAAFSAGDKEQL
jgi:hypothetical protein